ncbi:MAG: HEAT repeat domain-containing protein [Sulfuriferula sp.]
MTVANEIFCPNCFSMIPAEAETCPVCGERIASLSAQGYREKLLHALAHPLGDIRMRAIIALGLRRETGTAVPLAVCALRHPTDVVEGMEVVYALKNMGMPEKQLALTMLINDHAAHAVRAAAEAVLEQGSADDGSVKKMNGKH